MFNFKFLSSRSVDRIGPDFPVNHLFLFNKFLMRLLCKRKLNHFGEGAEIRLFAYLVGCSKFSIGSLTTIRSGSILMAEDQDLIGGDIYIGDYVLMGSNCSIYTSNHNYSSANKSILS